MMKKPKFSLVVWTKETNLVFFRDFMESLVAQDYDNWELYVMDEGQKEAIARITTEFFPEDDRVHYRLLRTSKGKAYAYNIGFHFVLTEVARTGQNEGYLVVADQHDRLNPNTLSVMAQFADRETDVIYTDHDELAGADRVRPHFKSEYNKELLLRCHYIGDFIAVSYQAARKNGEFQEKLKEAAVYDYLLRMGERKAKFVRIPSLLYHKRVLPIENRKQYQKEQEKTLAEYMLVSKAALQRQEIRATVEKGADDNNWKVLYSGEEVWSHEREYLFLHDPKVRPISRHNLEKMYGYLCQKDVAVVGARFIKHGFTTENCGYLFDTEGIAYPAFYGQKVYRAGYEHLASIPREVSMVDGGYCMVDAKVYRKLGGFDTKLSGRDIMLDFCLRVKQAGFRVIVDPSVLVRSYIKQKESTQESHDYLMEKWGETIKKGDPYYNPNLPLGLENYLGDTSEF